MNRTFLAIALIAGVVAIVPPHPDFAEEYYRRQKDQYGRGSGNLTNGSSCDDYEHHACAPSITELSRSAQSNLKMINKLNEMHPLVLLVQFTDHLDRELPTRDEIDELWNSDYLTPQLPTGSIKRYLYLNSYSRLNLKATVIDWIPSDNTELHYSYDQSGLNNTIASATYPVLERLDKEGYDFSIHDLDGDMRIDNIVFLHSGYAAEIGGVDCHNNRESEQRIWSHASSHESSWRSKNGYTFDAYMVSTAVRGFCGSERSNIGIITHELIHTWGIPDLYGSSDGGLGIGHYDIMSGPYGWDGNQTHPFFMSPWTRMKSGFLTPIEIEYDGVYTIKPSAESNQVYRISSPFPEDEYLLIENRQPLDYDGQMKGAGLLIWHIDEQKHGQNESGYAGQMGWPSNGKHYQVALVQADGLFDLERGENYGDYYDYFIDGDELRSTDDFYPNSNSYQDGDIRSTGVNIHDISPSSKLMSFSVSGLGAGPTSSPSVAPSNNPTMSMLPSRTQPSSAPSETLSLDPSPPPSIEESEQPSPPPSIDKSAHPSSSPSLVISTSPSLAESIAPSENPSRSATPSMHKSEKPSYEATRLPTIPALFKTTSNPSLAFSDEPTVMRSNVPSASSSSNPSIASSIVPSTLSSATPSFITSVHPTHLHSNIPSEHPTFYPSAARSTFPSVVKSSLPSQWPSFHSSELPSSHPSLVSSVGPTEVQTIHPSGVPTLSPSIGEPSRLPTVSNAPSMRPSVSPTFHRSITPSVSPTLYASLLPSSIPSLINSFGPSEGQSSDPSVHPTWSPTTNKPSGPPTGSIAPSMKRSLSPTIDRSVAPSVSQSNFPSLLPSRTLINPPASLLTSSRVESPSSKEPSLSTTRAPSELPTTVLVTGIAANIFDRKKNSQVDSRLLRNVNTKY